MINPHHDWVLWLLICATIIALVVIGFENMDKTIDSRCNKNVHKELKDLCDKN